MRKFARVILTLTAFEVLLLLAGCAKKYSAPPSVRADAPEWVRSAVALEQQQQAEAAVWIEETLTQAYDQVGTKNPRWDGKMRRLIQGHFE